MQFPQKLHQFLDNKKTYKLNIPKMALHKFHFNCTFLLPFFFFEIITEIKLALKIIMKSKYREKQGRKVIM